VQTCVSAASCAAGAHIAPAPVRCTPLSLPTACWLDTAICAADLQDHDAHRDHEQQRVHTQHSTHPHRLLSQRRQTTVIRASGYYGNAPGKPAGKGAYGADTSSPQQQVV